MKTKHLLMAFLAGGLLASCSESDEIQISGTVRNMQGKPVVYYQSVDGMFNAQRCDTLKVNPDSTFTLTFPAERYKRLKFILWGEAPLGSVILSENKIEVNLDGAAEQHLVVKGLSKKEMEASSLIDKLNEDVWDSRARRGDRWNIAKDTVAASVVAKLKADELAMEEKMKGLDEELFVKLCQDVRMHLMTVFQARLFAVEWETSPKNLQQWIDEWDKLKDRYSENHPESPYSLSFFDVVHRNVGITYFYKGETVPEGVNKEPNELSFCYCEHKLKGKAQEAAMVQLFFQDEMRKENAPVMIPLSERFKELHPQSVWMPLVDKTIAKNKAFQEAKIPDYIHFPNVENVKSLKELTDLYKGKVIFMDIWATWCGPCRDSFAHVKSLQEYAKEHDDVVLLYLSIDRPDDDAHWRKMAAHFDLMGEHVRIQEAFRDEIYQTFGDKRGALAIPRCVIFDKKGEIRFSVAASPEDMKKLKDQLEEARR